MLRPLGDIYQLVAEVLDLVVAADHRVV